MWELYTHYYIYIYDRLFVMLIVTRCRKVVTRSNNNKLSQMLFEKVRIIYISSELNKRKMRLHTLPIYFNFSTCFILMPPVCNLHVVLFLLQTIIYSVFFQMVITRLLSFSLLHSIGVFVISLPFIYC